MLLLRRCTRRGVESSVYDCSSYVRWNLTFLQWVHQLNRQRSVAILDRRSQVIQSSGNWVVNYSSAIGLLLGWILTVGSGYRHGDASRQSIRFSSVGTVSRIRHPEALVYCIRTSSSSSSEHGPRDVPRDAWQDFCTSRFATRGTDIISPSLYCRRNKFSDGQLTEIFHWNENHNTSNN